MAAFSQLRSFTELIGYVCNWHICDTQRMAPMSENRSYCINMPYGKLTEIAVRRYARAYKLLVPSLCEKSTF
jgi:hypothetical protein